MQPSYVKTAHSLLRSCQISAKRFIYRPGSAKEVGVIIRAPGDRMLESRRLHRSERVTIRERWSKANAARSRACPYDRNGQNKLFSREGIVTSVGTDHHLHDRPYSMKEGCPIRKILKMPSG